jgi:CubicO group peptidase (beta-lactamase class C family)
MDCAPHVIALSSSSAQPRRRACHRAFALLAIGASLACGGQGSAAGAENGLNESPIPGLEDYIAEGMRKFDVPGLAIGIIADGVPVYINGFGVRSKATGELVDADTVFQIASTSKAFLSATMAIAVDRGKVRWDDRIVDLHPDFQLKDPWVTREFRVYDIIAQRSGLPTNVNDTLGYLGFDADAMVDSLRFADPIESFRSAFTYTNVTHIVAGQIVAEAEDAADWETVLQRELFDPLGMTHSSYSKEAIEAEPNHAQGHRAAADGSVAIPFTWVPYRWGGAGGINSNVNDMMRWIRLQLANGSFEGRRIVSPESLSFTRTAKVADTETTSYDMGWFTTRTPNGAIVWHNGGSDGFGAYVGMSLERRFAVVILTNLTHTGMPDAIGNWIFDRVFGNPVVDHVEEAFKRRQAALEAQAKASARPEHPRPFSPLPPLAGSFSNPAFGKATVTYAGGRLVLKLLASGAELALEPWDGDIFRAMLAPTGDFKAIAESRGIDRRFGLAQFQMGQGVDLDVLTLTVENGQSYAFRRE